MDKLLISFGQVIVENIIKETIYVLTTPPFKKGGQGGFDAIA